MNRVNQIIQKSCALLGLIVMSTFGPTHGQVLPETLEEYLVKTEPVYHYEIPSKSPLPLVLNPAKILHEVGALIGESSENKHIIRAGATASLLADGMQSAAQIPLGFYLAQSDTPLWMIPVIMNEITRLKEIKTHAETIKYASDIAEYKRHMSREEKNEIKKNRTKRIIHLILSHIAQSIALSLIRKSQRNLSPLQQTMICTAVHSLLMTLIPSPRRYEEHLLKSGRAYGQMTPKEKKLSKIHKKLAQLREKLMKPLVRG